MKVFEQFKSEIAGAGLQVILELRAEATSDEIRLSKADARASARWGRWFLWCRTASLYQGSRRRCCRIVQQTLVGGQVVERLLYKDLRHARAAAGLKTILSTRARIAWCCASAASSIPRYSRIHSARRYRAAKKPSSKCPEEICKTVLTQACAAAARRLSNRTEVGNGEDSEFSEEVHHLQR